MAAMRALLLLLLCAASLCAGVRGQDASGKKPTTLVLAKDASINQTHSQFLSDLRARGHTVEIELTSGTNHLSRYGKYYYDNVIIFAADAEELGGTVNLGTLIEYVDAGRNLIVAGTPGVLARELANELGVDFDEDKSVVIDHANYDSADTGDHTLVATSSVLPSQALFSGSYADSPILFRGIGHAINAESPYVFKVATGSYTAFSYEPNTAIAGAPQTAGTDTVLVSAVQTQNNARIIVTGSLELFGDKFFSASVSTPEKKYGGAGNRKFCAELSKWAFKERGVLRATELTHRKADSGEANPASYRVKDNMHFSIKLEEFNGDKGGWVPFTESDVQLELVMLDPYIRTMLKHDGQGVHKAALQVPDVFGIYKLKISYHRIGWSNVDVEQQVSIRPYRHDEFERFILAAYPYYASALSMMGGFFIFGVVFLYQRDDKKSQ